MDKRNLPFPIYGYILNISSSDDIIDIEFKRDEPSEIVVIQTKGILKNWPRDDKRTDMHTVFSLFLPEPPNSDYYWLIDTKLDQISIECKNIDLLEIKKTP